jgi:hypothetical protein
VAVEEEEEELDELLVDDELALDADDIAVVAEERD